jgi:hypothetical protein
MTVGDDELVVITNGAKQMSIVAFWATLTDDEIAGRGYDGREAGQYAITCGFADPGTTINNCWIQSEQSVVVNGHSAFVVNNISADLSAFPNDIGSNNLLQVSLVGPSLAAPTGVEKLSWNHETKECKSEWSRVDVASTSMVPIYSQKSKKVFVSGWEEGAGWILRGLDWDNGDDSDKDYAVELGTSMLGNGAYSLSQFLDDGSLILNSIVGPIKISPSALHDKNSK